MQQRDAAQLPFGLRPFAPTVPFAYSPQIIRPAAILGTNVFGTNAFQNVAASQLLMAPIVEPIASKPKVANTVYISKIPSQFDDEFMQELLKQCGKVSKWTRTSDPTTGLKCSFGFCDFEDLRGVCRAIQVLSKIPLPCFASDEKKGNSTFLLIKCEDKLSQLAEEWRRDRLNAIIAACKGDISNESATMQLEAEEEELKDIFNKLIQKCFQKFKESEPKEDKKEAKQGDKKEEIDLSVDKNKNSVNRSSSPSISLEKKIEFGLEDDKEFHHADGDKKIASNVGISYLISQGALSRDYRPHWREREREFKLKEKERELEKELLKREREREKLELILHSKETMEFEDTILPEEKEKLIEMDCKGERYEICSSTSATSSSTTTTTLLHSKRKEERRKKREREKENDDYDRMMQKKELEEAFIKNKFIDEKAINNSNVTNNNGVFSSVKNEIDEKVKVKTADELTSSLQMKKEDMEKASSVKQETETKLSSVLFSADSQSLLSVKSANDHNNKCTKSGKNIFGEYDDYDSDLFSTNSRHRPLTKLETHLDEKNKLQFDKTSASISASNTLKGSVDHRAILSLVPTEKSEIFSYKLDWELMEMRGILETKLRSWVRKKIVEYMGGDEELVEEVIEYIINRIKERPKVELFLSELEKFLDSEAEGFLKNLYKMLIFEQIRFNQLQNLQN